jgi:hypothetical protein
MAIDIQTMRQYRVLVYGRGGLVGSLLAAANSEKEAKLIGANWARQRHIDWHAVTAKQTKNTIYLAA